MGTTDKRVCVEVTRQLTGDSSLLDPRDWIRVIRLGGKLLYLLNHLINPLKAFYYHLEFWVFLDAGCLLPANTWVFIHVHTHAQRREEDGGMGAPGKHSLELPRALSAVGPARTQDTFIMSWMNRKDNPGVRPRTSIMALLESCSLISAVSYNAVRHV